MGCTMKRSMAFIVVSATLAATRSAHADPLSLMLTGQMHGVRIERKVSLRLLCSPDPHGGTVSLELEVPQAYDLKDFDYGDFEGPDAVGGARNPARLRLTGAARKQEFTHSATGWYSAQDPNTFVFGLSQLTHKPGKLADLVRGIDSRSTHIEWKQRAYNDSKRELRAVFALDPPTIQRIRDTVDACVKPAPQRKPARKKH